MRQEYVFEPLLEIEVAAFDAEFDQRLRVGSEYILEVDVTHEVVAV